MNSIESKLKWIYFLSSSYTSISFLIVKQLESQFILNNFKEFISNESRESSSVLNTNLFWYSNTIDMISIDTFLMQTQILSLILVRLIDLMMSVSFKAAFGILTSIILEQRGRLYRIDRAIPLAFLSICISLLLLFSTKIWISSNLSLKCF